MANVSSENLLESWICEGKNRGIPRKEERYDSSLCLTSQSILGVMLAKYSMVTAIENRIRFFGGDGRIRSSLEEINGVSKDGKETKFPGLLVIADDVCGGIFALNHGFVKNAAEGSVLFLPYQALSFEDLKIGHADFVHWCMTCSVSDWMKNGWKTSEKDFKNNRETDAYIAAKLNVLKDLKGENM